MTPIKMKLKMEKEEAQEATFAKASSTQRSLPINIIRPIGGAVPRERAIFSSPYQANQKGGLSRLGRRD